MGEDRDSRNPVESGAVGEYAEQPRLHRCASLEPVDASHHTEPRVLDDLLGDRPARYERLGEPQQALVVAHHEITERLLVAGAQGVEQHRVRIDHGVSVGRRASTTGQRISMAFALAGPTSLSIELARCERSTQSWTPPGDDRTARRFG